MNCILLKAPRYSTKEALIAKWKVGPNNKIVIEAKRADGSLRYPNPIFKSGQWLQQWPVEVLNGGFEYYAVPITDLLEDDDGEL